LSPFTTSITLGANKIQNGDILVAANTQVYGAAKGPAPLWNMEHDATEIFSMFILTAIFQVNLG